MQRDDDWVTLPVPVTPGLARPVHLRAQALPARHTFPVHTHPWHQLVYAVSGVLVVTVRDHWFIITPEQAVWVPVGTPHTTGALQDAAFRTLYVAEAPGLPAAVCVLPVSDLLKALIGELPAAMGDDAYAARLNAVIVEQLARQRPLDFHLPWPASDRLRRLCEALYQQPADDRDLSAWGRDLGASPRTLLRHFEREVGMSLRQWRQRLRLFRAIEWLGAGRGVTDIALDLGYGSASAFIYMFRREMGVSPAQWQRQGSEPRRVLALAQAQAGALA